MLALIVEIIGASLIAYAAGTLLGGIPFAACLAVAALCAAEILGGGIEALPTIPFIIGFFIYALVERKNAEAQDAAKREARRQHDEAMAKLGPAVVPLSESELQNLIEKIYAQYCIWRDTKYDHTWVVITFERERVRFSAVGAYPPYTGFTEYYPYSHQVFGSTEGMTYDEFNARANEQWAYRKQVSQRILSYIRSRDTSHLPDSLWIDNSGDILSSSQH